MTKKSPYAIIQSRRTTEKSRMLENLQNAAGNPSVSRCKTPKYVFNVDPAATKQEIARALEEIYADKKIQVLQVNTVSVKSKQRRVRGFLGQTAHGKKAIVMLSPGNTIDEQV